MVDAAEVDAAVRRCLDQRTEALEYEFRVILPDGKRKDMYARTRKEAAEKLKLAQRAIEDGADLSADRLTVAQYLDQWLTACVKPSTRHKTFTTYESLCRIAIVPRIGNVSIAFRIASTAT